MDNIDNLNRHIEDLSLIIDLNRSDMSTIHK